MSYSNQFKEAAQVELSKRLGYKNLVECVQAIGSKEFKRRVDKFYPEYYKEEKNRLNKYFKSRSETKNKGFNTEGFKLYKEKLITIIEDKLKDLYNIVLDNPNIKKPDLIKQSKLSYNYMTPLINLGYLKNSGSNRDPIFKINFSKGKTREIATLLHEISSKKQEEHKQRL